MNATDSILKKVILRKFPRLAHPRFASVVALLGAASVILAGQTASPGAAPTPVWDPPRLADGQPDIQGMWIAAENSVFTLTPSVQDDRLGPPPKPRPNAKPRPDPSRVLEPDHVIPYQSWAKEKQLLLQSHKIDPSTDYFIDPQVR